MCWSDLRKSGRYFLSADRAFPKERGGWREPLRFLLLLQAVSSVLTTAALFALYPLLVPAFPVPLLTLESALSTLASNYLVFLILTLAWAFWLHLWVALLGGRAGLLPTVRSVVYGSSPRFWFLWVPLASFFFILWAAVNTAIGLRAQRFSAGRAIGAVALAVLIALLIVGRLALLIGPELLALAAV